MKDRRGDTKGITEEEHHNQIINRAKHRIGEIPERRKGQSIMSDRIFLKMSCNPGDTDGSEHHKLNTSTKKLEGTGEWYIKDVLAEQITDDKGANTYRFWKKIGDPYDLLTGDDGLVDTLKKLVSAVIGKLGEYQSKDKKEDRFGYFNALDAVLSPALTKNKKVIEGVKYKSVQDIDDWKEKISVSGLYFSIATKYWTGKEALFMSLSTKLVREAKKAGVSIKVPTEKKERSGSKSKISTDDFKSMFASAGLTSSDSRQTSLLP